MYKSKLQELCQKKKWALPDYTFVSDGEDHCPLFKASVVVGGITFNSPPACKSSKQAHNHAAHLAFLHFTSADERSKGVEKKINEKDVESSIYSDDMTDEHSEIPEKRNEFNKKLEMYAQKKNLNLPVYRNEKEGLCFRARVSIGGDWFQSPEFCETIEDAQDSAAQSALLSLSTDAFHENGPCSYKTLLHELAKSEGYFLPIYTTIGSDRFQTFSSSVYVEGEAFQGEMAKSKELAELNAARTAYTVLTDRNKLFQPGSYFSPRFSDDNILKLAPPRLGSIVISDDPQENPISESQVQKINGGNEETVYKAKETAKADCSKKMSTEEKSYLLCNRVMVFTCIPNMALPAGTVLLPIKENMWTIVTLEFPNEKSTYAMFGESIN